MKPNRKITKIISGLLSLLLLAWMFSYPNSLVIAMTWCETNIGPWFIPSIFGFVAYALVMPAFARSFVEGMQEAQKEA